MNKEALKTAMTMLFFVCHIRKQMPNLFIQGLLFINLEKKITGKRLALEITLLKIILKASDSLLGAAACELVPQIATMHCSGDRNYLTQIFFYLENLVSSS